MCYAHSLLVTLLLGRINVIEREKIEKGGDERNINKMCHTMFFTLRNKQTDGPLTVEPQARQSRKRAGQRTWKLDATSSARERILGSCFFFFLIVAGRVGKRLKDCHETSTCRERSSRGTEFNDALARTRPSAPPGSIPPRCPADPRNPSPRSTAIGARVAVLMNFGGTFYS